MALKHCDPVSQEIFNRDYRRKSEEEKEAERIAHIPFVSRKKKSFRNVEPTLSNHEFPKASTPLKINLMDRIAAPGKTIKEATPKKSVTRSGAIATKGVSPVRRRSLKGMSKEERQEHRNRLAREKRARDKENGTLKKPSEERRIKQLEYLKQYYANNKEKMQERARKKREAMDEKEKEAHRAYMSEWQKKNRELVNARAREWKRKKREAKNNTFISVSQSLSA